MDEDTKESGPNEQLSSEHLAGLIVDALLVRGLLEADRIALARAIATEEIDARKALGDY